MSKAGYCQHDAGILDDDELSAIAKKRFIDDVLKELRLGSAAVKHPLFPVNLSLPPQPSMANVPLDDPKAFPEFHKRVLGQYRDIARALDAQSRYTFLPVCCPVSLAVSLGADVPKLRFPDEFITYGFALPLLAVKLGFPVPVDLAKKLPSLLGVPIPDLKLPKIDFDPNVLPDLLSFNSALLGLPPAILKASLDLLTRMPQLALGVLSFDLSVFYDVIVSSQMFGSFDPSSALVWMVAQKVLAIRTAECILIYVVGTTMGSSAGGIVGGLGTALGYVPPPAPPSATFSPRRSAVKAAKGVAGQSLTKDVRASTTPGSDVRYAGFLLPQEVDDGGVNNVNSALQALTNVSCGPLFARAVCFRAGASSPFFTKRLSSTDVSDPLKAEIEGSGALVRPSTTQRVYKEGDIIVSDEVSFVVTSRSDDGSRIEGIMGGSLDVDGRRTAINEEVIAVVVLPEGTMLVDGATRHKIAYIIDVDKFGDD